MPIFRRLGLGSVLGYLAAGLAIGPFGLGLFTDPQAILHVAELGVVMFLFVIGLEMQPSRLWSLRREIFGLGAAQVVVCGALLTLRRHCGRASLPLVAFVAAMGFVLSSTADRHADPRRARRYGDAARAAHRLDPAARGPGDRAAAGLVAFLAPGDAERATLALASVAIARGCHRRRWWLPAAGCSTRCSGCSRRREAREVMTAAALLVVLGAALLMQLGGLSMAMGAFLAGVLLSESTFRHQLEADVEPFRGILLGLFFLGVGMSLDLAVIARDWPLIAGRRRWPSWW